MDWKDIGEKIVGMGLPLLGTAIAGPAGGAVGSLVANVLGVREPTPEKIMGRLDSESEKARLALESLQAQHRFELESLSLQCATREIQAVNMTMQAESKSEDPWSRRWRPFWGFCSAVAWTVMAFGIAWDIATGKGGEVIGALAHVPESYWLIPLTILGVASYHRGKKQRIEAGESLVSKGGGSFMERIRQTLGGSA